jgi:CRP-like cAMP-binding protein
MSPQINDLLASLPEDEYRIITERMHLFSLQKGQTLFHAGDTVTQLYFPVGALVSMIVDQPDGGCVETYMMGNACFVGVGTSGQPSFYRATVRNSGLAYRISVADMRRVIPRCPVYVQHVNQGVQLMLKRKTQSIYCGKKHSVDQQLIRWLLVTLDRTLTPHIQITHREISDLLAFRREGVTLAIGRLLDAGFVEVSRGHITVLDREGLENLSCDCYWIGQGRHRPMLATA